jgi:uridylate kinase
VYTKDPMRSPDAQRFDRLTYIETLNLGVKVLDSTAISLCMDNQLPIIVLNLWEDGSIDRAVLGETVGTIICL